MQILCSRISCFIEMRSAWTSSAGVLGSPGCLKFMPADNSHGSAVWVFCDGFELRDWCVSMSASSGASWGEVLHVGRHVEPGVHHL